MLLHSSTLHYYYPNGMYLESGVGASGVISQWKISVNSKALLATLSNAANAFPSLKINR